MKTLEVAIASIVEGDLSGLSAILVANHGDLLDAAAKRPQLTISRPALRRVLTAWHSGLCTAGDVQHWASFIRRGYIAKTVSGGVVPINIGYDPNDEDMIADIIGRLDEIGDKIDGDIGESEQTEMLKALRA